jgi:hypothetical protein
MTIKQIISRGEGWTNGWQVTKNSDPFTPYSVHCLIHHGTLMARWRHWSRTSESPNLIEYEYLSLGWGSVSDQNGMNIMFRIHGAPYNYSRAGGAYIRHLETFDTLTLP